MERITCDRSVFLIRHGEYLKSVLPHALTSLGIEQARKTGRRLNKHLIKGTIQTKRIVHSGLHRAIQTAKEIQTALDEPIELKEDITLNEGSPSDVSCYKCDFCSYVCTHCTVMDSLGPTCMYFVRMGLTSMGSLSVGCLSAHLEYFNL